MMTQRGKLKEIIFVPNLNKLVIETKKIRRIGSIIFHVVTQEDKI